MSSKGNGIKVGKECFVGMVPMVTYAATYAACGISVLLSFVYRKTHHEKTFRRRS